MQCSGSFFKKLRLQIRLEEWLTDRTQLAVPVVDDSESAASKIESGVIQGTVMGPPLFTIYTYRRFCEINRTSDQVCRQ
jgi:hypothetical protein